MLTFPRTFRLEPPDAPEPARAAIVAAAALGWELWLRRESYFITDYPAAFAAYAVYAASAFWLTAFACQALGVAAARLLGALPRVGAAPGLVGYAPEVGFVAAVALTPIVLGHIGIRGLRRPDAYTFAVLAAAVIVAGAVPWASVRLRRLGGDRRRGTRRLPVAVIAVTTALVVCRAALAWPDAKLVILTDTLFSGQVTRAVMLAFDFDRDGVPGRFLTGADLADFDPRRSPFAIGEAIDCEPCAAPAPARGEKPRRSLDDRPNVILVIADTFAYSHTGASGYERLTTPRMDEMAREGAWFEHCFVPVGQSVPSYTSIFTGTHPYRHGVLAGNWNASPSVPDVWSVLNATYETLHFAYTRKSRLSPGRSTIGAGAEVGMYSTDFDARPRELFDWIRKPRDEPFFAWLFLKTLHAPHHLPDSLDIFDDSPPQSVPRFLLPRRRLLDMGPADRGRMIDRYDGAVRYVDECVGALHDLLFDEGMLDRTVLIVTGDHGEAFFDHDRVGHGQDVYDEHLHVPLLACGWRVRSGRMDPLVSSLDLAPTILDLAGLEVPATMEGRSLVPALLGGGLEAYPCLFAVGGYDLIGVSYYDKVAVRTAEWKLIHNPVLNTTELYDLVADPGERRNVAGSEPAVRAELTKKMLEWPGFYPIGQRTWPTP